MISPASRGLVAMLRGESQQQEPEGFGPEEPPPPEDDPRYLMFKMRRKRQNALLKQMLVDAGYGDLAKMSAISRDEIED